MIILALLSLAHLGLTKPLSTHTVPQKPNPVVRDARTQTPTLLSDFQKNNVTASWADGHPLQWGSEIKTITEYPANVWQKGRIFGGVTDDEKLMYLSNGTTFKIINLAANGTVTAEAPIPDPDNQWAVPPLLKNPKGGYDVLLLSNNGDYSGPVTLQIRVSDNGTLMEAPGTWAWYYGALSANLQRQTGGNGVSRDRKIVGRSQGPSQDTYTPGLVHVHSLDDPKVNVTIEAARDVVYDSAFSPDGKLLSTAGWDGYGKLWDIATSKLLSSIGPIPGRSMFTNFSPDGKFVLFIRSPDPWATNETDRGGDPNVHLLPVASPSSNSSRISIGPFRMTQYYEDFNPEWSPDGKRLAVGTCGQLQVFEVSESGAKLVQDYLLEDNRARVWDLVWLEDGKRLTYRVGNSGIGMYDFETNKKFWWGPGDMDRWDDYAQTGTMVLPKRGWIGGVEADRVVKFWKYPA